MYQFELFSHVCLLKVVLQLKRRCFISDKLNFLVAEWILHENCNFALCQLKWSKSFHEHVWKYFAQKREKFPLKFLQFISIFMAVWAFNLWASTLTSIIPFHLLSALQVTLKGLLRKAEKLSSEWKRSFAVAAQREIVSRVLMTLRKRFFYWNVPSSDSLSQHVMKGLFIEWKVKSHIGRQENSNSRSEGWKSLEMFYWIYSKEWREMSNWVRNVWGWRNNQFKIEMMQTWRGRQLSKMREIKRV